METTDSTGKQTQETCEDVEDQDDGTSIGTKGKHNTPQIFWLAIGIISLQISHYS